MFFERVRRSQPFRKPEHPPQQWRQRLAEDPSHRMRGSGQALHAGADGQPVIIVRRRDKVLCTWTQCKCRSRRFCQDAFHRCGSLGRPFRQRTSDHCFGTAAYAQTGSPPLSPHTLQQLFCSFSVQRTATSLVRLHIQFPPQSELRDWFSLQLVYRPP
jgi:hypothetical protein